MAQFADILSSTPTAPPWLSGEGTNAKLYMYAMGLALDMLTEKMNEAMLAHCPGYGDPSVIPLQAADRLFVQGPAEPNASFVQRLKGAYDAWARAGSRPAVLEQLQAYLTDLQPGVALSLPEMLIVGGNTSVSIWDTIFGSTPQGAAPAHTLVSPANWNWDGQSIPKRAWLVLFMNLVSTGQSGAAMSVASTGGSGVTGVTSGFATLTGLAGMVATNVQQYLTVTGAASSGNNGTFQITSVLSSTSVIIANRSAVAGDANNGSIAWSVGEYPYIAPAPVWGSPSFVWGAGTWGVSCSELVVQSIRAILKTWKSAATFYPNIIIAFGGGDGTAGKEYSPLSSAGAGNPDGTWGDIGKLSGGAWVPAKTSLNPFDAFCDGTGLAIQCCAKNVT
jgi:hypothetical protein